MRCLVTGGAGFIGSHLVERLVAEGHEVRVLDDLSTGRREQVGSDATFLEGDVRDTAAVARAIEGCETVFHVAALPSVQRSIEDPATAESVNGTGTVRVLAAAADASVRRVVYSSSSSVYGDAGPLPKREDHPPAPCSPYAASKLTGERAGYAFHRAHGLSMICLRYFNVFGPRQDPGSPYAAVIPRFITRLLAGEPPTVYGDGEQTRDFTHVDDVVAANLAAARAEVPWGIYNVACGERTSLNRLLALLGGILGTRVEARHAPARPGDVRHSQADPAAASRDLGWRGAVSLEAGLRRTVAAFRERG